MSSTMLSKEELCDQIERHQITIADLRAEVSRLREHIIRTKRAWTYSDEDELSEAINDAHSAALAVEGKKQ